MNHDTDVLTLESVISAVVRAHVAGMAVGCPARVHGFDHVHQTADVQPVVRGRHDDDDTFRYPVIPGVPVRFPQGAGFAVTWPLEPGDFVWLDFGDRSLDEWLTVGGDDVTPASPRRFDLSDAVAWAGIRPPGDPLPPAAVAPDRMIIGETKADGMRIEITPASQVRIGTPTTDLLKALVDALDALLANGPITAPMTLPVTGTSPAGPVTGTATGTAELNPTVTSKLTAIREAINSIRVTTT